MSKKVTDFVLEDDAEENQEDVEETVGVRFDEEDDDDKGDMETEIRDEDDDDDDEQGVEADVEETLKRTNAEDDATEKKGRRQQLHPREINAQWIARQVSNVLKIDEVEVQKKEQKILDILEHEHELRLCENKLYDVLDAWEKDRFDLVKILVQNRLMILYCTKLAKAEPEEKKFLEQEMSSNAELSPILRKLKNVEVDDAIQDTLDKKERAAAAKRNAEAGQQAMAMGAYEPKIVKFDELAFAQGSHFNSNKKCVLPQGTEKTQKKSYESVIIPPQKPKPFEKNEELVPIEKLPKWAQDAFQGFASLNRIQSKISEKALKSDGNLLICAPTGAGKTNVAVMCILREVSKHMNENGSIRKDEFKCIYVAPMRSLVQEMVGSFTKRFKPYGLEVCKLMDFEL